MFFLSGLFLGLSYLAKLWLIGPFGIGLIFILVRSVAKKEFKASEYFLFSALLILAFVATSSIHLAYVRFFSPDDLSIWVSKVYFGLLNSAGGAKDKINNVHYWNQPFYYYFYIFVRDFIGITPLIVLIVLNLKKVWREFSFDSFNLASLEPFSFVLISFVNTKEPMYILPSLVAFILILVEVYRTLEVSEKDIQKSFFVSIILFFGFVVAALNFNFSNTVDVKFLIFQSVSFIFSFLYLYLFKVRGLRNSFVFSTLVVGLPFVFLLSRSERKYQPVIEYIESNKPEGASPEVPYVVADDYSHIGFKIWNNVQKFDWVLNNIYEPQSFRRLIGSSQYKFIVINPDTKNSRTLLDMAIKKNFKVLEFGELKLIDKTL